ncbi:hypothetical protein C0995_007559 [Termitomyces sp. Mi166|nr:hypothetical protein C0995_007559 [Termitomyces sp. Mi166\
MAVLVGTFTHEQIQTLQANPRVEGIYEDVIIKAAAIQTHATWGLARLSSTHKLQNQDPLAATFTYRYNEYAGENVDVYVLDSGVYVDHIDFGGRARWGPTFGGYSKKDETGHGTHVAGIIASNTFGVAKRANIIAIKILGGAKNHGYSSDLISALDYVFTSAWVFHRKGRRSVVNISMNVPGSLPINSALAKLKNKVILIVSRS